MQKKFFRKSALLMLVFSIGLAFFLEWMLQKYFTSEVVLDLKRLSVLFLSLNLAVIVQYFLGSKAIESNNKDFFLLSDALQSNFMVIDQNLKISYLNAPLKKLLSTLEKDIKNVINNFNVDSLTESNVENFYNLGNIFKKITVLTASSSEEIQIGSNIFKLTATPVMNSRHEKIATVLEWEDLTQQSLQKKEITQLTNTLNLIDAKVMITDHNYDIVYLNKSLYKILQGHAAAISKEITNFNVDKLIGTNVDVFHKKSSHKNDSLNSLTAGQQILVEMSGVSMNLTITPISNELNQRTGTVIEWIDKTQELIMEAETEAVISAAILGDLTVRLSAEGKNGFFEMIANRLNALIDKNSQIIADVSAVIVGLAIGDLRNKVENNYQGSFAILSDNANLSIENLNEIIQKISGVASVVNQGISEIAEGNQSLQSRTDMQASALEETAASMEEIAANVKENTERAMEAVRQSREAQVKAEEGGKIVLNVIGAMDEINNSSKEINEIVSVIDEIAFQTNLLALNAAVEAARAGEQGSGFSVVASEVRNLAQRSATSAKKIKELIANGSKKIEEGIVLAEHSGDALKNIISIVTAVNQSVKLISDSSLEQNAGIQQINEAVINLDTLTQQNTALVEEISSASEEMKKQSQALQKEVNNFQISQQYKAEPKLIADVKAVKKIQPPIKNNPEPKLIADVKAAKKIQPPIKSNPESIEKIKISSSIKPVSGGQQQEEWESF